jgi:hypothetical protein
MPPAGSKQLHVRCVERRLDILAREVMAAGDAGTVILGGDFNAKVGNLSSPMLPDGGLPARGSSCPVVDDHGRKLVQFCERTGLVLCTGRVPGDLEALPTWRKRGAPSRLDHVLISRHAFHYVESCIVPQGSARRDDSDHDPLILRIRIFDLVPTTPSLALGTTLRRIAWDPALQPKYSEELARPSLASQLADSRGAALSGDAVLADKLLTASMTTAALAAGARRKGGTSKPGCSGTTRQDAPWYDGDCRAAHKAYWAARRSTVAGGSFGSAERYYHQVVRGKRRRWQQQQLGLNLADARHNPRALFLRFNDSPTRLPAVLRNHEAWASFLNSLASYRPPPNCRLLISPTLPFFDQEAALHLSSTKITCSEVFAALHNGRSPGCSELPAEWIRYAVPACRQVNRGSLSPQPFHLLAETLAALFTATFSAQSIPDSWATSAVTPIYKKGDPVDTANYRPVAVSTPIARLYASVINNRVSPYLEAQGLRAQAQAGFRAHRSVNHNLFALQHAIDKSRRNKVPLYCCFVDLTAAFDRVPRSLLWERLRSCGVTGQMLAAIQALYSDAHIVINIDGCIGDSATVLSGVKQGCPLSPTLFGIFIDALEGWLSHRVPAAGVRVQSEGGAARLLSTLIYADDLALLANCPLQLQALIDALAEFCSSAGLAVSAAKTQVMQFLPRMRGQALPLHSFWYGSDAAIPTPLLNTSTYKYLGIHFCSSGNPSDYMKPARDNISRAYHSMRRRYCGLACGKNVWLQLQFFMSIVNTTTLYGGELWGVHPRTAAQRHITTQKYSKHLRQLLRISPSVNMAVILSEIGFLSLQQQWLQASIRFWNQVVALPAGDLYRDLMFDSLQEAVMPGPLNKGFVKGLHEQCAQLGFPLTDLGLLPVSLKMIMHLSQLQRRIEFDDVDTCPRTCPSAGAMVCTYRRWFLRDPGQGGRPFLQLPANARKVTQLLRFRLGCHGLPSDVGRHRADPLPRHERLCTWCYAGRGDEKHMVFECSALQHIRDKYSAMFAGHNTMRSFMNQTNQRGIIHFISECLDCSTRTASGV